MTAKEAAEMLDLIADRAPALRTAGVLRVELGDVVFTLAAVESDIGAARDPSGLGPGPDDEPPDVLHDAATFGDFGPDARPRPRHRRPPLIPEPEA